MSRVANAIQVLTPKALSSIPPIQTGIPASSANLLISREFVIPPTLPGLIFMYLQASISIACLVLSTPFIDSSRQIGVSIIFESLE